jgi:hypothetical protein
MERRATPEEERELVARLEQQGNDEVVHELLIQLIASATTEEVLPMDDRERRLSAILEIDKTVTIYKKTTHPFRITFRRWGWVAASVLLLLAETAVVMLAVNANRRQPQAPQTNVQDIAPGSSKAIRTLGSRTTVRLDSAGNQDLKRTSLEEPVR